MNLIMSTGGLGNQMFGYALMVRLSQEKESKLFYPYKRNSKRYGHEGFQLDEIFELRPEDKTKCAKLFWLRLYWNLIRIFPKKAKPNLLKAIGFKEVSVGNFIFDPKVLELEEQGQIFMGTWQSEKYFCEAEKEVRNAFIFKEELLNEKTLEQKEIITNNESVAIHVRRDDYLTGPYAWGFGGICTPDYYSNAIDYLKQQVENPSFFVFSDDLKWCKDNLDIPDAVFVDWNRGKESWQDMYLMSKCKHNIIANSTFSWWGAWLNANPRKIVIAPSVWWNGLKDDVVPETWIRLDGKKKNDS